MSRRRRPSRSVRKRVWKLIGFASPREHRVDREARWRMGAPIRQALAMLANHGSKLMEFFAEIGRAFAEVCRSLASLRKDDVHAFS